MQDQFAMSGGIDHVPTWKVLNKVHGKYLSKSNELLKHYHNEESYSVSLFIDKFY